MLANSCEVGFNANGIGSCDGLIVNKDIQYISYLYLGWFIFLKECGLVFSKKNQFISKKFSNNRTKIVGGQLAVESSWPTQALINVYSNLGRSLCGGTLISRQIVLTAAHCLMSTNPDDYVVYLGVNDHSLINDPSIIVASVEKVTKV